MGSLFGAKSPRVNTPTPATALRVQTAVNGQPIPFGHGQNRGTGNILWYGGFEAIAQKSSPSGSGKAGGGGGGKGSSGTSSYTYQADIVFGLGEGPIDQVVLLWNNKTPQSTASINFTTFDGSQGQAAWGFIESSFPNQALTYSSLAYVAADPLSLGDSPELPNLNWEIRWAVSGAVTEIYAVASPYTYTAAYFSLAAAVTELVTVPLTAPYTIQAQTPGASSSMPVVLGNIVPTAGGGLAGLACSGVVYTDTGVPLVQVGSSPAAGQYSVDPTTGIYAFSAANSGTAVTIIDLAVGPGVNYAYQPTGVTAAGSAEITGLSSMTGIVEGALIAGPGIPPGTVVQVPGSGTATLSQPATASASGVTFTVYGAALVQVLDSPSEGEFTLSAQSASFGQYTFSPADAGQIVVITDIPDADPAASLTDFLSNPRYGCGFPVANIGDLTVLQNYAHATGLFISPLMAAATAANSYLGDFSTGLNGEFVWSGGLLTFVPYGDQTISGNGKTYTAPSAPIYSLGDDDFLPNEGTASVGVSAFTSDDPVVCVRKRQSDAMNDVKVEYLDRGNAYNPAIVEAQDDAAIDLFGLRPADTKTLHFFCIEAAALTSAQLQLGRQQIRNLYSFTVPWYFILLDPMDIIAISDAVLGLDAQWVRILEITENQQDWSLTITAEEVLDGTGSAPLYGSQPKSGYVPNYNADPGDVNTPIFFEPTDALAGGLFVWAGISGQDTALWGGCNVYLSYDDVTYQLAGQQLGPARMGVLAAALPSVAAATTGATIDTTSTLAVDVTESDAELLSGSQSDMLALNTLCYVASSSGGELLAYETASLAGPGLYDLTILNRGACDTPIASHAPGSAFLRLDGGVFEFPFDQARIGRQIYVKFASFNLWGGGQQDLADVSPYAYTLQGTAFASPLPDVANLTSNYIGGLTQLAWSPVSDFRNIDYEIRQGASWSSAQFVGRTPNTNFQLQGGNGVYWVAAHANPITGLDVYSEAPTDIAVEGATLVRNVVAAYDEAALHWPGMVSGGAVIGGGSLVTTGSGNTLGVATFLGQSDFLFAGDAVASGIYTAAETVNTGRVEASYVTIDVAAQGIPTGGNFLGTPDFLGLSDLVGGSLSANISVQPQIRTAGANGIYGTWQNYQPGQYNAQYFQVQLIAASMDTQTQAEVTDFSWTVDMPDRVDQYQNIALAAGGSTLAFQPLGVSAPVPFNGGPGGLPGTAGLPAVQVTWSMAAGDTLVITALSLSSVTLQITNGGAGVARTLNAVTVQGY